MEWLKLCVFAMDAGANLQTGMISHLRSKEPNIRLSQLSQAWFQKNESNIIPT